MKKGEKKLLILIAVVLSVVGVAAVSASVSSSFLVTLNKSSTDVMMNNLTGDKHYGMARAVSKPSSSLKINWKLYKKSFFSETCVGSGYISQLDDMAWHSTSVITYQSNGNYRHNFYSDGYYYGNVQGTNN